MRDPGQMVNSVTAALTGSPESDSVGGDSGDGRQSLIPWSDPDPDHLEQRIDSRMHGGNGRATVSIRFIKTKTAATLL